MSQSYYGREMEGPPTAGSVRRARELAQANANQRQAQRDLIPGMPANPSQTRRLAKEPPPNQSRLPKPQPPAQLRDANGLSVPISRPTQIPQWPLPGPASSHTKSPEVEPYQPPPGRSQPPQRPPRPSQVPSMLDSSRLQEHTPVFAYHPHQDRDSVQSQDHQGSVPPTPSSRQTQSSISSVGSIPDFPIPSAASTAPPPQPWQASRRSANLGPPPSSRRGNSSFYSNASFVSPIPEESPRNRSHTSFASSAAMPESWGTASPEPSPMRERGSYLEDGVAEEDSLRSTSQYGEEPDDESKLVRSASIGKRGKPAIVINRGVGSEHAGKPGESSRQQVRPDPSPMQGQMDPFENGTGYVDMSSSSSSNLPTVRAAMAGSPPTADAMLGAYAAASSPDPAEMRRATPSPRPFSRLSAVRRPPKLGLDMDSVRAMEARGSITSLPDLIKRATRLAAMMDRGKRPASRFDDLSDFPDEKEINRQRQERHQSGLSDMLAAFPPPAATPGPGNRSSWFRRSRSSWPLAPSRAGTPYGEDRNLDANDEEKAPRRRCCGLPMWAFLLILFLVILIVAAAVIVPVYFFVLQPNQESSSRGAEPALADCRSQLNCQNGGTNVVADGVCSCICTGGFTGSTCDVAGATGCTTTNLVLMADEGDINNVTLGQAIPRLIQQAQTNFSVPLVGTTVLAKFNQEGLSCIAQNSLVTFDGRSTRMGVADDEVVIEEPDSDESAAAGDLSAFVSVQAITVPAFNVETTITSGTTTVTTTITSIPAPPPPSESLSPTSIVSEITPTETGAPAGPTFVVTEEVLDFSRAAVLYILQERSLDTATRSQTILQRFFAAASRSNANDGTEGNSSYTEELAMRVRLADGVMADLVNFLIDVSGDASARSVGKRWASAPAPADGQLRPSLVDVHQVTARSL